jgi:photosystem II stability/assembly factor-like uncharacterized protein
MKKISFLLIIVMIIIPIQSLMCQWTKIQTGLTGENVISLAIKSNGYIYAGTNTNGAYKSTNNGDSWWLVLGLLNNVVRVFSLAFDALGNVYAGTYSVGLLRSTDDGVGWSNVTNGLPQSDVRVIAISPTGTFFASDDGSIYRSSDNGSSWNEVRHSSGGSSGGFQTITFGSSRVYIGGDDGFYYSTNDGINWTWVGSLTHAPLRLAVNDSGYVFAGTSGWGVFRSTNLGVNWAAVNTDLGNLNINTIAINSSDVIYVGTTGGVYVSTDNGSHWVSNNSGLTNTNIRSLAFDYFGNVYAGAFTSGDDGGLWKSIAILPVELSSFTAYVIGNAVKLSWETKTEVNNYGFELERSKMFDAKSETWEKIGFINGNGNSNSPKSYFYEDKNVTAGKYSYRLKQIDNDGQFEYSKIIEVNLSLPVKFELSQNYPNPFNPVTTIRFSLPQSGNVKLTVFNILGEEVTQLVNGFKEAGVHAINFNAENFNSGLFIYKMEANGFVQSRKMLLVK